MPSDDVTSNTLNLLRQPYALHASFANFGNLPFPRPNFEIDINARLAAGFHLSPRHVLYVGPSNLGKTLSVLGRCSGRISPDSALQGVVHLPCRRIP